MEFLAQPHTVLQKQKQKENERTHTHMHTHAHTCTHTCTHTNKNPSLIALALEMRHSSYLKTPARLFASA